MASATVTAKSEPGRSRSATDRLPLTGSRLGRLILLMNIFGLVVLIGGALVLNELRRGLIEARLDSLKTQSEILSYAIVSAATEGDPEPRMNAEQAVTILALLGLPRSERARLYDGKGKLIADTDLIADKVIQRNLGPARPREVGAFPFLPTMSERSARAHAAEQAEVRTALSGQRVAQVRESEGEGRLVSVSTPLQHVHRVLGVLTVEAGGVDDIVAAERRSLMPFILFAVLVTLVSSIVLDQLVARPVLRLARAADSVRLARARAMSLPDLAGRNDELGDLTRSLESMTETLSARLDAIDRFAADVAHEIKNPLTSIRSAVETLELAPPDSPVRDRLVGILKSDVRRMDRLITDISNASRVDAELSREQPRSVMLDRLLADIVATYVVEGAESQAVVLDISPDADNVSVSGRETPLGQVFRNLIDNARSFSPPEGTVRVSLGRESTDLRASRGRLLVTVEDDGPGVPPENLESIFERFYTARPKGQAFGGHSGLGLSIARQIIEAHSGEIHAENRVSDDGTVQGARFVVALPERQG